MDIDLILGFTRTPIPYLGEDRRTLSAIPQSFSLDKKWPVENNQMAFALTAGFVAESIKEEYTGALAAGRDKNDFQFILRPNIEFLGIVAQERGKAVSTVAVFVLPAPVAGICCIRGKPQGNSGVSHAGRAHLSKDECIVTALRIDTRYEERTRSDNDR